MIEKSIRPAVLQCKDYVPGKPVEEVQRELGLTDVLKMASNENPLGTSPKALEAMVRELTANANRYPESLCVDLVDRLCEMHSLAPTQVMVDNGLDGVITVLGMTFIDPGDEVVYASPSFPAYENITRKMGGVCVPVALDAQYRMDLAAMAAAVTPKTKVLFVCNPNNPTGTVCKAAQVETLLQAVPKTVLVVLDEAYYHFVKDPDYPDSVGYLKNHENVVVLRTFSKIMGLAAQRVGYAMANEAVIKGMLKLRQPFPVNRAGQAGALASLDDVDFIEETLRVNNAGREQYYAVFREWGLPFCESHTNFIYVELPAGCPAQQVFGLMLQDGVIVRPQSFAGRPDALRITFGTREENDRTLQSMRKALTHIENNQ